MPLSRLHRGILGTAIGLVLVALLGVAGFSYVSARRTVFHRSLPSSLTPADSGWAYAAIPLRASDGTKLGGWWMVPPDSSRRPDLAVVILAHGHNEKAKGSMLRYAGFLHRAGFIVVLFDFRSYGESEGTVSTAGWLEQQDVQAAVRLARERAIGAPVILFGESMGAAASLLVAAQDPAVAAVVNDSGYPALETVVGHQFERYFGLPRFPFAPLTMWFSERLVGRGFRVREVTPLRIAPLAGRHPVLSIYGAGDRHVPPAEARAMVQALGPANATWAWFVPGAGHASAIDVRRPEYEARVLEFLDAVLAARAREARAARPTATGAAATTAPR